MTLTTPRPTLDTLRVEAAALTERRVASLAVGCSCCGAVAVLYRHDETSPLLCRRCLERRERAMALLERHGAWADEFGEVMG